MEFLKVLAGIVIPVCLMIGVIWYSRSHSVEKKKTVLSVFALLALLAGWIYYKLDIIVQTAENVWKFILDKKWFFIGGAVVLIILIGLIIKLISNIKYRFFSSYSYGDDDDNDEDEDDEDEDDEDEDDDDNNVVYIRKKTKAMSTGESEKGIDWESIIIIGMPMVLVLLVVLLLLIFGKI